MGQIIIKNTNTYFFMNANMSLFDLDYNQNFSRF